MHRQTPALRWIAGAPQLATQTASVGPGHAQAVPAPRNIHGADDAPTTRATMRRGKQRPRTVRQTHALDTQGSVAVTRAQTAVRPRARHPPELSVRLVRM